MNRKELEKRYNDLVKNEESLQVYDGRGKGVDVYTCEKCCNKIYTVYVNKGVTPFCMPCPKCGGTMQHTETVPLYQIPSYIKIAKWICPSFKKMLKGGEGMIDHVLNGGLVLENN